MNKKEADAKADAKAIHNYKQALTLAHCMGLRDAIDILLSRGEQCNKAGNTEGALTCFMLSTLIEARTIKVRHGAVEPEYIAAMK